MNRRRQLIYLIGATAMAFGLVSCQKTEESSVMMQGGGPATLQSISPADGTASVSVDTSIQLTFSRTMDPKSLTTSKGADLCGGAVALSSDGFVNCVAMTGSVDPSSDKVFNFKPNASLANGATYKVRLTVDALSSSHHAMAQTWTSNQGFITLSATGTTATTTPSAALSVTSVFPASGAMDLGRNLSASVTFSQTIDTTTIINQATDGVCTGTFQISADNFANCVATNAYTSTDFTTFNITPVNGPSNYDKVKFRVKAGVTSTSGNALAADWSLAADWTIVGWKGRDGGLANGLNYDSTQNASSPVIYPAMTKLFASWSEPVAGVSKIRVRSFDYSTKTWTWADGNTASGINQNGANNAVTPNLVEFNGNLYATWAEHNGTMNQIRVKRYNGAVWDSIDGNNSFGINVSSTENANNPKLVVHSNQLYVIWSEMDTTNFKYHVKLAMWNGTVTNTPVMPPWTTYASFNYAPTKNAVNPVAASSGTKLYFAWAEENGSLVYQTRFAEWDGTSSRIFRDGNSVNGLNSNTALHARYPKLAASPQDTFITWRESDTLGQIRLSRFDPLTLTASIIDGGGTTGINYNTTQFASDVSVGFRLNKLLFTWHETNGTYNQIRSATMSEFGRQHADGGGPNGINTDPTRDATSSNLTVYGDIAYATWVETNYSAVNLIHVAALQ